MNKVFLTGNLGGDCTTRGVNEKVVISFNVGDTNRRRKDAETLWWNCEYWVNTDAVAQYLKKGTRVSVVGTLEPNNYTNKNGEKIFGQKLRVDELEFSTGTNTPTDTREPAKTHENAPQGRQAEQMPEQVQNLANAMGGARRDDLPF